MIERDDLTLGESFYAGVPVDGRALLVYGECPCGWWCACPEGGIWPKCPRCDVRVLPPPAVYAADDRLAFVATLRPEQVAVAELQEERDVQYYGQFPADPRYVVRERLMRSRHYSREQLEGWERKRDAA